LNCRQITVSQPKKCADPETLQTSHVDTSPHASGIASGAHDSENSRLILKPDMISGDMLSEQIQVFHAFQFK